MSHVLQRTGAPRGAAKRNYSELYAAIASLPERDRVLIHQVYWDGRSLRQIARTTDLHHSSLENRHDRIIRDLRRIMDGSPLGERRIYHDGAYWAKCRCGKWVESSHRCACGAPEATLRVFDFQAYTVTDPADPRKSMRSLKRGKKRKATYLERHSDRLEREADAILRADDERQAREEAS